MNEIVGVSFEKLRSTPKRELLLFDKLSIEDWTIDEKRSFDDIAEKHIQYDIEWLIDNGLVELIDRKTKFEDIFEKKDEKKASLQIQDFMIECISDINPIYEKFGRVDFNKLEGKRYEAVTGIHKCFKNIDIDIRQALARFKCIELQLEGFIDANPIFYQPISESLNLEAERREILKIVLNILPIPDELTPLEAILDFRSDLDSSRKFSALKKWINKISRELLTVREVEDEIEHLIHEYKQHLEYHKLKYRMGTLETIVTTGASVLENTLKFKFKDASKAFFDIKRGKLALMEAELKNPGREIAYIMKIHKAF